MLVCILSGDFAILTLFFHTHFCIGANIPFLASLSNSFGPVQPKANEQDVPATPAPIYRFVPEFEVTNYNAPSPVISVAEPVSVVEQVSVAEPIVVSNEIAN